jgi:hypothetical protein
LNFNLFRSNHAEKEYRERLTTYATFDSLYPTFNSQLNIIKTSLSKPQVNPIPLLEQLQPKLYERISADNELEQFLIDPIEYSSY